MMDVGWRLALLWGVSATAYADEAVAPTIDTGTTAWMLVSTALVLLMVPGLGMFYGGLVRTKNVLGTMMHSFSAMAMETTTTSGRITLTPKRMPVTAPR